MKVMLTDENGKEKGKVMLMDENERLRCSSLYLQDVSGATHTCHDHPEMKFEILTDEKGETVSARCK